MNMYEETKSDDESQYQAKNTSSSSVKTNLSINIGPYFDIENAELAEKRALRKPSKELLQSVKLRPTYRYESFPTFRGSRSDGPCFNTPRLGYSSINDSPPVYQRSPNSVNEYFGIMKQMTLVSASITGINYILGFGVLGLPYALMIAGWSGIVSILIVGVIMGYCGILLGRCQYRLSSSTYPDIAEAAYGYTGRDLVSIVFYFQLLFDMALFLSLLTDSVIYVLSYHTLSTHSVLVTVVGTISLIALTFICGWSMRSITWLSIIGTTSTLFMCILVIIACSREFISYHHIHHMSSSSLSASLSSSHPVTASPTHNISSIYRLISSIGVAIFNQLRIFGILSFSFTGHAVLPSIFKDMISPCSYPIVVYIIFGLTIVSYIMIASIGYIAYGDHIKGNIIDNLPVHAHMTIIIAILILTTAIIKFLLAAYPVCEGLVEMITTQEPIESMESFETLSPSTKTRLIGISGSHGIAAYTSITNIPDITATTTAEDDKGADMMEYNVSQVKKYASISIRIVIPLVALALMLILPHFIKLLSIIGAIFGTITCIIIPCVSYLKLFRGEVSSIEKYIIWSVLITSCIAAIISLS